MTSVSEGRSTAAESTTSPSFARRWWPRVRVIVSVALLAAVVSRLDLDRAAQVLSAARLEYLVLAVVVGMTGRFFAAFRWHLLIRAMGRSAPYLDLVRLTFIGMFLQFFPAGAIALEVGRVYGLNRAMPDLAGALASVLAERVFGFAALVVLALVGLTFAPEGMPEALRTMAWVVFLFIAAAGIAVMSERVRGLVERGLGAVGLAGFGERLRKLYDRLDVMKGNATLMGWSAAAALFNTIFRILPTYLVALALGVDVSLIELFVIIPIIVFAQQIPISVGGLGVREVGWVALLGAVGVPTPDAVLMSLVLVAVIFTVALPGAWFYARHGLDAPDRADA